MSDVDLNAVKAGDYVLVVHRWDQITSKPGQPFDFTRHRKGDTVTLDVEQARRLVVAGAVVKPGDVEKAAEVPGREPSKAPGAPKSDKVEDILADVGDDLDKAEAALALEQEKGDKARSTLVGPLEKLLSSSS